MSSPHPDARALPAGPAKRGAPTVLLGALFSSCCFFLAVGAVLPVLPGFIGHRLAGGSLGIGWSYFAYSAASIAIRPWVGRHLARAPVRPLVIAGLLVFAGSVAATAVATDVEVVVGLRILAGAAEGAVYTGMLTEVISRLPHERRGRAISYFSAAMWAGLAAGPVAGVVIVNALGYGRAWLALGALPVLAIAGCLPTHSGSSPGPAELREAEQRPRFPMPTARSPRTRFFIMATSMPALTFALTMAGYSGFQSFIPIYGAQRGLTSAGGVFFAYGATVLLVRIVAASLSDRRQPEKLAAVGCVLNVLAMGVLITWARPITIYASAVMLGLALAIQYPSLLKLALAGADQSAHGQVIAVVSGAFDAGYGLGVIVIGATIAAAGFPAGLGLATGFMILALGCHVLRFLTPSSLSSLGGINDRRISRRPDPAVVRRLHDDRSRL
ncbi:MAG TPA: MFS transporter [Streptosporangiaceae bacterium]|nr:MFS transporter [Streptosporangiaceae bacterium]